MLNTIFSQFFSYNREFHLSQSSQSARFQEQIQYVSNTDYSILYVDRLQKYCVTKSAICWIASFERNTVGTLLFLSSVLSIQLESYLESLSVRSSETVLYLMNRNVEIGVRQLKFSHII